MALPPNGINLSQTTENLPTGLALSFAQSQNAPKFLGEVIGQEAVELNRKIRGMEMSFAWKITAPLRY
jgi:hypothetical protein